MFYVLTVLALIAFVFSIAWSVYCMRRHKGEGGFYKPLTIWSVGVIAVGAFLYFAYYALLDNRTGVSVNFFESFFTVIHDVYQLFSADSDYTGVFEVIAEVLGKGSLTTVESAFFLLCRGLYVLLYAIAPILTLGVILSIFKDLVSQGQYFLFNYRSDVYIFSELNERSLAMASSVMSTSYEERVEQYKIAKKELDADFAIRYGRTVADVENEMKKALADPEYLAKRDAEIALAAKENRLPKLSAIGLPYIRTVYHSYLEAPSRRVKVVFLGVEEENDEDIHMAEQARRLGGIVFRKGVLSARLQHHNKNSNMYFFMIGENEAENVDTAIGLLAKYATRDKTKIFVFSDSPESELLLKSAGDESRNKAAREEEARLSVKERTARALREEAEEEAQKKREAEQLDAILKTPENPTLYICEADSDYRKGALVKRVNVIRSLIYHTLYHFTFISDYEKEYEAKKEALIEKNRTLLEMAQKELLPDRSEEYETLCESYREAFAEDTAALKKALETSKAMPRNIFERAAEGENGEKVISAVVIGTGLHGTEMIKALAWYGQMEGYRLYINAFDRDAGARSRFAAKCPELMCKKYNSPEAEGSEECYHINIETVDIDSEEFIEMIKALPKVTYVAVCLGNDEKNLEIAVKMRSLCRRFGGDPLIQAIRYNLGENEDFSKAVNFKNQAYDIDLIGDLKSIYSVEAIMQSKLEHLALSRHMKWGGERSFWAFEYNYNSSIASALHHDAKIRLGLPGADLPPAERRQEDLFMLRRLEHRRWNAYMRSEGYSYGKRDDLAKLHHCLVPFDALPLYEQLKDDD